MKYKIISILSLALCLSTVVFGEYYYPQYYPPLEDNNPYINPNSRYSQYMNYDLNYGNPDLYYSELQSQYYGYQPYGYPVYQTNVYSIQNTTPYIYNNGQPLNTHTLPYTNPNNPGFSPLP